MTDLFRWGNKGERIESIHHCSSLCRETKRGLKFVAFNLKLLNFWNPHHTHTHNFITESTAHATSTGEFVDTPPVQKTSLCQQSKATQIHKIINPKLIQTLYILHMSHFAYACKTEGKNGISRLISALCINCLISILEYSRIIDYSIIWMCIWCRLLQKLYKIKKSELLNSKVYSKV